MKRGLSCFASLGLVALFAMIRPPHSSKDRINAVGYSRIRLGMDLKKACEILGGPAEDYSFLSTAKSAGVERHVEEMREEGSWHPKPDDNDPRKRWCWLGGQGAIVVRVDRNGDVTDRMFLKLKPFR